MDLIVFVFYSTLLFGWGFGMMTAVVYPLVRQKILGIRPEWRTYILMGGLLAPLVLGLFMTSLLFFPYSPIRIAHDLHCSMHQEGPHLLMAHSPLPEGADLPVVLLLCLIMTTFVFVGKGGYKLARAVRFNRNLQLVSQEGRKGVRWLASDQPLAFSAGIWKPMIYISSALKKGLSKRQQRVVIAHERAHIRRYDALRHWLGGALSFPHLSATRKLLLSDLVLSAEQACDKAAAFTVGDSLDVADSILAVERLKLFPTFHDIPLAAHFHNHHTVSRIEVLVGIKSCDMVPSRLWALFFPAVMVAGLMLVEPLHHGTEWMLSVLLR